MRIEFITSLAQVDSAQWNALWPSAYPFTRYEFLAALEHSGSTAAASGWGAQHALVWAETQLLAAMPLYAKTHSYGEYVFDWNWANAYQQHGFEYYPKLLNAIPFTPATGPRFGIAPHLSTSARRSVLLSLMTAIAARMQTENYSSFHSLFADAGQRAELLESAALSNLRSLQPRFDCQFHWFNQNFTTFDQFLETFNSRKRKAVRKERNKVIGQKVEVGMVDGTVLTSADWHYFHQLYQRTYLKRSGHGGYLNEAFFQLLGRDLKDQVVLCKATREGEWLAAALYLRDQHTLYGRYWGAVDEFDGLHFECCYYQGIEYAIAHQLQRFDPGAQGEHKIARGFTPVLTSSLHHIAHPGFAQAIADFLRREQADVKLYCQQTRTEVPFKEGMGLISENHLIEQDTHADKGSA